MTGDIITATADWLTATGAPNAVVLLALLTSPVTWSKQVKDRLGGLLDRVLPAGDSGDGIDQASSTSGETNSSSTGSDGGGESVSVDHAGSG